MTIEARTVDRLLDRADVLAAAWSARARASTTPGCERALLRLSGVSDLDRAGRPLAWSVVDRYLAGHPERLPGGILSAFAVASLEYELGPQELALDVAAGAIDLGLEAELLGDRQRREDAEAEARRWAAAATERIDANRVARRELIDVLGDAPLPWIGAAIDEPEAEDAADEAAALVGAGIDVVRVDVPVGRELADRLTAVGVESEPWRPRTEPAVRGRRSELVPAGSQRGLAALRGTLDEAAAGRESYVRLATTTPRLAAPEGAAVAAFERVDMVEADPMAEILGGVDPDRALADHAFAHRLLARAGTVVALGPGPLVVAPDLARGVAPGPAALAGRALALELVAVAFARHNGLPPSQVVVGAMPDWLLDGEAGAARAIADIALRRRLFPDHLLWLDETARAGSSPDAWLLLATAALPISAPAAGLGAALLVTHGQGERRGRATAFRDAAGVARAVAASRADRRLIGPAENLVAAALEAARELLDGIADEGWRAVLGEGPTSGGPRGLGAGAIAERSDSADAFPAAVLR
ncbi:MAG TPA: lysine 5,6-aminomutase subunit alpha [Candidatus Limnocylindrales bacterium]|nr:lysine 5,6-aminomutase subunit alpha [Candidatus Limnocylindrales bacterium]